MGEPKSPLDIAQAEIARLERQQQKLRTILTEQGVKLDPTTPPSLTLNPGLSRVWSTMWGRDGNDLRVVQVDGNGQVVTRPPCWEKYTTIHKTPTLDIPNDVIVDFGKVVDFVQVHGYNYSFSAEFSMDNDKWYGLRYPIGFLLLVGRWGCQLSISIRCQYVKIIYYWHVEPNAIEVVGEVSPPIT